ncbi:hypothetical protein [Coleofasciculus sp. FACHB-SPT36]|uniref:hypothetical protein n=1 Tax=Cyanophyceae TaxID=3028117 RepID=UPI00168ACD77|nr:hypothetical protein [Coleofasciculus sp. FACHB-SPT36]MBD2538644.1 hypothetical protein [Coleofasciculus sp. FACHB-SPT36]
MTFFSTRNGNQPSSTIEIIGDHIVIRDLEIRYPEAANYLRQLPQSQQESTLLSCVEMGFACIQVAHARQDTAFIEQRMQALLSEFQTAVSRIVQSFEQELVSQIGTENGQVLAPLKGQINQTAAVLTAQVDGVRTLLARDIDPHKETSVIGSVLKTLTNLLNPKLSDSIQGSFKAALANVTADNGTLAKAVKSVVSEAVKPLASEVDKLRQEIRDKQVTQAALEQTTAKGAAYEEIVLVELQDWSKICGAEIHHVAKENEPGDILIKLTPNSVAATEISIIIEARNRPSQPWGRKMISQRLTKALAKYEANAGIFLSHSRQGFAREIGEWTQGTCEYGLWVATTHELLTVALQFLIVRQQLATQQAFNTKLDYGVIEAQIQRIQSSLNYISQINSHLTYLQENTEGIRTKAKVMKAEIQSALGSISESLRVVSRET